MKFELTASSVMFGIPEAYAEKLQSAGFQIELGASRHTKVKGFCYAMIEISSLEELLKLKEVVNQDLILFNDSEEIEIYDDSRE